MKRALSFTLIFALLSPQILWAQLALPTPAAGLSAVPGGLAGVAGAVSRPAAPGPGLDFHIAPEKIGPLFEAARLDLKTQVDALVAVPAGQRTFQNTVLALEKAYTRYSEAVAAPGFLFSVSPDPAVREAVKQADALSDAFLIELSAREDVYKAVKEYAAKGEALSGEDKKLLETTLRGFRRDGMDLPLSQRADIQTVQKRLAELSTAFSENLKDADDALAVEPGRLKGLPDEFVRSLPVLKDGKVRVGLDYPTYRQVMKFAEDADVRRQLEAKFNNQASAKNVPILEETLRLREKLANLLGYKNFADYALSERMAKSPSRVWDFLKRLKGLLYDRAKAELTELLEVKRRSEPGAKEVENWDISFYARQLLKQRYDYDPEKVREYFPADTVVAGTLEVYQQVLGLKFHEIQAAAWHPDVRLFEISDAQTSRRIGWFYLDLYPREGKYKHAAAFTIRSGHELPGGYQEPVSAMVANFSKALPGKPSLLTHGEVETFFHEFGHLMHQTLTKARYASFSGSRVARDFVEAPSQMLENFVWRPEVLAKLSGHYQDPSKKLPKELLDKMLSARNFLSAMGTLGQVALAALDLVYHTAVPVDSTEVMRQVFEQFDVKGPSPDTHFQGRFGHLMGGYSAGYYGYLWSKVFALDIFSLFEKEGVLNPAVGRRYREAILERGSSVDENEQMKAFLGREPNEQAFLRSLGLAPSLNDLSATPQLHESAYGFYSWLAGLEGVSEETLKAGVLLGVEPLLSRGAVIITVDKGVLTALSMKDPSLAPIVLDLSELAARPSAQARALAGRVEKARAQDQAEGGLYFRVAAVLANLAASSAPETAKEPAPLTPAEDVPLDPVREPKAYLVRMLRDAMRAADPFETLAILRKARTEARLRLNYQDGSRFLEGLRSQAELRAAEFLPGMLASAQEAAGKNDKASVDKLLDAALEFCEYAPGWKNKVVAAHNQAHDTLALIAKYGLPDEKTGRPAAAPEAAPEAVNISYP